MEVATYVYPVNTIDDLSKIPEWIVDILNKSPKMIHFYQRLVDMQRLTDAMNDFTMKIFGKPVEFDIAKIFDNISELKDLISLLKEQHYYFYWEADSKHRLIELLTTNMFTRMAQDCNIWLIVSTVNSCPYGAVFAFQNIDRPTDILIQGVSKFLIPYLFTMIKPELASRLPKLNSLLMPVVETLAKNVGADRILVEPIGKQGQILLKHYGFSKTLKFTHPCLITFHSVYDQYYEKRINQSED
jgi:hypothetical protein